jgi:hypothetical protein
LTDRPYGVAYGQVKKGQDLAGNVNKEVDGSEDLVVYPPVKTHRYEKRYNSHRPSRTSNGSVAVVMMKTLLRRFNRA